MKNKYQKALSKLEDIICELSCELKKDYELYTRDTGYEEHIEILQKLVDKETPIKPKRIEEFITFNGIPYKIAKCPNCKGNNKVREYVSANRCYTCGQKLDWSDTND